MVNHRILNTVFAALFFAACSPAPRIGVISSEQGLASALSERGYRCEAITLDSSLGAYDLVWYHRPDTSAITQEELAAGPAFVRYMEKGGKVVLSMDAVRLAHAWGIEENPVETGTWEAVDDGFGRKVGYHAWRSHPLFDGMHGGAYVWHGHEDNVSRVLGYTDSNAPRRPGTRIAATLWALIFYHPDYKVIWDQKVGRGELLSIGCFLYYDRPNYNTKILNRFTSNVVNWLTGGKTESPERYWTYEPARVLLSGEGEPASEAAALSGRFRARRPVIWDDGHAGGTVSDAASMSLSFAPAAQEVIVPTRRCMTVCDERGGIKEIWTHPIMSIKDFKLTVASGGEFRPLNPAESVTLEPGAIRRTYRAGNLVVEETICGDVDGAAVVAHYEWQASDGTASPDSLIVEFSSNMRYMWPYDSDALGSVCGGWNQRAGIYSITAGEGEFVSLAGSNLPARLIRESRHGNLLQLDAALSLRTSGEVAADIVLAAGNEGVDKAYKAWKAAAADPEGVYERSREHWQRYLEESVSIESPDPVFNEGYRWATVSAGQFLAETPGLGTGVMAGYASSLRGWGGGHRVSGRPGYAWYFGRDSEIAGFAYLAMGDFASVRYTLEMLSDYQGEDGPIFHELTTSGSDHFDASDATPLYVVLMADYLRATGDVSFVRAHMPNIYKAMEFCMSTDTDGDHFIEIRHVGHGWLEGGDYFADNTEFYLCGIWARALEDAAWLAELDGKQALSESWAKESGIVKKELDRYWNPKGYYNYGIYNDGSFTSSLLTLPSFPIWLGVTDPQKARSTMEWFIGDNFTKPWGVRQSGDPRDEENVGPYDESNIWPLLTGSVALAEYTTGLSDAAFYHLMGNLGCYSGQTHGRVPEVLRGNAYRSGGITAFQCWSETGVTGPAILGMLGWRCNALEGTVSLSPQLPPDWDTLRVRNLRVGNDRIGFDFCRCCDGTASFEFTSTGSPKECTIVYGGEERKITLKGNTKLIFD